MADAGGAGVASRRLARLMAHFARQNIVSPDFYGEMTVKRAIALVAGLLAPAEGIVKTSGAPVMAVNNDCGYMFQVDALLPWKTALDNVLLGPTLRGIPKIEARTLAHQWLDPSIHGIAAIHIMPWMAGSSFSLRTCSSRSSWETSAGRSRRTECMPTSPQALAFPPT